MEISCLSRISTLAYFCNCYCFIYFCPSPLMKSMSFWILGDGLPFVIKVIGLDTSGVLGDLIEGETIAKGPSPIASGFDIIVCLASTEVATSVTFFIRGWPSSMVLVNK